MIKITEQEKLNENSILFFSKPLPTKMFNTIVVDGIEYKADNVFGIPQCIAVKTKCDLKNKTVEFILKDN